MSDIIHTRRLYFEGDLTETVTLEDNQHHYIRNVMRMSEGDIIRLFNEHQGEWAYKIDDIAKKRTEVSQDSQLRAAPEAAVKRVLIAPILSKERMFWMVEKATELGMTDLQPVICARSDVRKLKQDKVKAQLIEATEQSEGLRVPHLHPLKPLKEAVLAQEMPVLAAIERCSQAKKASNFLQKPAIKAISCVVGPAGGFDDDERTWLLAQENVQPVDLGNQILRVETAVCSIFSIMNEFS